MPRRNRAFKKGQPFRDAKYKLIITEGLTEVQYFTALLDYIEEIDRLRFKIKICPYPNDGRTVPKYIIGNALEFRAFFKDFKIGFDEVWIVIDKDLNDDGVLKEAARDCDIHQFNLTVSTPCFEVWLLLHYTDLETSTYNISPYNNGKTNRKAAQNCEKELRRILGTYNKTNLKIDLFFPHIKVAIKRAKELDILKTTPWLNTLGTRVYKIMEALRFKGIDKIA